METYRGNSYRERSNQASKEDKKIGKVTTGKVRTKKKSEMSKLKDVFIAEDVRNVKSYVVLDVLVPAIKKAIYDIVVDGVGMILGESVAKKRSGSNYVSYRDCSSSRRDSERRKRGYEIDDVILDSRGEAEEVLDRMDDVLDEYKVVTVSDFYDLVGISDEPIDHKYGWRNIASAEVVRARDGGYMIRLPRPMPID